MGELVDRYEARINTKFHKLSQFGKAIGKAKKNVQKIDSDLDKFVKSLGKDKVSKDLVSKHDPRKSQASLNAVIDGLLTDANARYKEMKAWERKAWDTANRLWIELDLVSKRIDASLFRQGWWSVDEQKNITATLKNAKASLNAARTRSMT